VARGVIVPWAIFILHAGVKRGRCHGQDRDDVATMGRMRPLLLAVLICVACAAPRRADSTSPTPAPGARIKDSVPERRASLNAADRDLQSEGNEQRWGFEEARRRREAARRGDAGAPDDGPISPRTSNGSLIPSPKP